MKYIHYGSDKFSTDMFNKATGEAYGTGLKPCGGLWGCPLDTKNNWHDWCLGNNFRTERLDKHFIFEVKDDAKILKLHTIDDLDALKPYAAMIKNRSEWMPLEVMSVNFIKLIQDGWDGIEVYIHDEQMYFAMYGWDVDSIVVFNSNCLIFEEE